MFIGHQSILKKWATKAENYPTSHFSSCPATRKMTGRKLRMFSAMFTLYMNINNNMADTFCLQYALSDCK